MGAIYLAGWRLFTMSQPDIKTYPVGPFFMAIGAQIIMNDGAHMGLMLPLPVHTLSSLLIQNCRRVSVSSERSRGIDRL